MMKGLAISVMLAVIFSSLPLYAEVLGTFGKTYSIAENDAYEELMEKVQSADWEKLMDRKKAEERIKAFKPEDAVKLPRAEKERTRLIDLTYTLDFDIPDGRGGILYPRGYTFNPLEYVNFTKTLVVIDGTDRKQIEWFKRSTYFKDIGVMLLITDGKYYNLMKELKRPVFYARRHLVERLNLQFVPSVIQQRGRMMEVREIRVGN